jgi:hypothetical protein
MLSMQITPSAFGKLRWTDRIACICGYKLADDT